MRYWLKLSVGGRLLFGLFLDVSLSVLGAIHCLASEAGRVDVSAGHLHLVLRTTLVLLTFSLLVVPWKQ